MWSVTSQSVSRKYSNHLRIQNDIVVSLCKKVQQYKIQETNDVKAIRKLLEMIPTTNVRAVARALAEKGNYNVLADNNNEIVVTFRLGSKAVRLMQAKDVDVGDPKSYGATKRAASSAAEAKKYTPDLPMTVELQQYLMALAIVDKDEWNDLKKRQETIGLKREDLQAAKLDKESSRERRIQLRKDTNKYNNHCARFFLKLRDAVREDYWLLKTPAQREQMRNASQAADLLKDQVFSSNLNAIKENWRPHWNSSQLAKDYFHHYLIDQTAAEHAWNLVEEDLFVVTDKNRRVVFANLEKAGELLFGKEAMEVLIRCLDMWKFFCPLPAPESCRHVVDNFIRRKHPELDPSAVNVEHLANAVMAVAHYGCWSTKVDPYGRKIVRTWDARFGRTPLPIGDLVPEVFCEFAKAALGLASKITRFLTKPLDPEYYEECVKIFQNLPELERLSTDDEDFISLFAFGVNGYTQRHRDVKDIGGGLAGLFSTGDYQGKDKAALNPSLKETLRLMLISPPQTQAPTFACQSSASRCPTSLEHAPSCAEPIWTTWCGTSKVPGTSSSPPTTRAAASTPSGRWETPGPGPFRTPSQRLTPQRVWTNAGAGQTRRWTSTLTR